MTLIDILFKNYIKNKNNWDINNYKCITTNKDCNYGYIIMSLKDNDLLSANKALKYMMAFTDNLNQLDQLMDNTIKNLIMQLDFDNEIKIDFTVKDILDNEFIVLIEFYQSFIKEEDNKRDSY